MRAVRFHEFGGPEVLRLEEVARPEPAPGELLLRVSAASANPFDSKLRRGAIPKQLPAAIGTDMSGTVERSRSEEFEDGEAAFGVATSGSYAEYAVAPASMIARKPAEISHAQAAAIPVAGVTAWQALYDRGEVQRGQTALIAGAAGGVGHFAVQFAARSGARVIGIGSARNREFVLGLGAERFVDYTSEDLLETVTGVDFAFDTVGGTLTERLLRTVRPGGVLVTIAGAPPQDAARREVRAEHLLAQQDSEQLRRIAQLVAGNEVRVEISQTLPLEQAARAHELIESGHTRGKIVLLVDA